MNAIFALVKARLRRLIQTARASRLAKMVEEVRERLNDLPQRAWRSVRQLYKYLISRLRKFCTNIRMPAPHNPARRRMLKGSWAVVAALLAAQLPVPAWASTNWFVDSGASGTNAGTSWTNAALTVTAGLALVSAGDTIFVKNTHSVTAGAVITWTPPAGGIAIISVTPSGASGYSAYTAGAAEAVGAASAAFSISQVTGAAWYIYGMSCAAGTNSSGTCLMNILATNAFTTYIDADTCTFTVPSANNFTWINLGLSAGSISGRLKNCTFAKSGSGNVGTLIQWAQGVWDVINPTISITGGAIPVTMISPVAAGSGILTFKDGDISGYAVASSAYIGVAGLSGSSPSIRMINLKLSSTPTLESGTWPGGNNGNITWINCDSGNTDYKFRYVNSYGSCEANASIYRSGGATFNSEPVSWKVITAATCSAFKPFILPFMSIWDTTTTGETPSISVAQASGATNLNDQTAWLTLDSAASATTTQYSWVSGRNAQPVQGTPVDWGADSATWTGISTPNKQLLTCGTVTPARAGLLRGRVIFGGATITAYVDAIVAGIS